MNSQDIDNDVTVCLKQGDRKRKDILVFLRKYGDLTGDQLRRSLDRLIKQRLIERKRYSIYGLTEKGKKSREGLDKHVISSLEHTRLTKILNKLPLHLRAFVTLYLCGIIARYHLRPYFEEGFPSFLIYGKKGVGKTKSALLAFKLLDLDPEKHTRYVPNATPGELGLRRRREKGEQGYTIRSSSYFEEPAICFEEIDKANKPIRDALLVYFQGRRSYFAEGKEIKHKVCAMMTSNQTPEKIKIPPGIPRRTPMLNTDAIQEELEDVDLVFRKIFAGSIPHLELNKLEPKLKQLPESQYKPFRNLLKKCVTDEAWQYKVDTESTVILSLAMQALLGTKSIEQAILLTLYYRLPLLETTQDTVENWKDILFETWKRIGKPEQIIELKQKKETTQVPPLAPEEIEVEKRAKKFQAADKKDFETVRETVKFGEEYRHEVAKLKKWGTEIEEFKKSLKQSWEKINHVLVEQGYEVPSPETCENALQLVNKKYKRIQDRDWDSLKELKKTNDWLKETYIRPSTEAKQLLEAYEKLWGAISERISNAKKTSEISPIREIIDECALPAIGKDKLKEIIDQKEATLKKKKQLKTEELVSYLREMKELGDSYNQEKMKKLGQDITEELVQLELVKKENEHLRGKNGQVYALDAFNLQKCADIFSSISWDDACCQALTLLTGVKHKTLAERMGNFSFSGSRKEGEKEKMPTWGKWALGLGITGVGAYSVYLLFKNRKPPCYIQTQEDLIQVRFLREEGNWLVFQSKDGQKWKLPCNTTRIAVLLKPEYGGQAYWFIRREKENLIVQVDHNDEKIPITQVDKIIYQAPSSEQ